MDECVDVARALGRRLADELQIPVYFYEHAATRDDRRSLADIRVGEYEGLEQKLRESGRGRPTAVRPRSTRGSARPWSARASS